MCINIHFGKENSRKQYVSKCSHNKVTKTEIRHFCLTQFLTTVKNRLALQKSLYCNAKEPILRRNIGSFANPKRHYHSVIRAMSRRGA